MKVDHEKGGDFVSKTFKSYVGKVNKLFPQSPFVDINYNEFGAIFSGIDDGQAMAASAPPNERKSKQNFCGLGNK